MHKEQVLALTSKLFRCIYEMLTLVSLNVPPPLTNSPDFRKWKASAGAWPKWSLCFHNAPRGVDPNVSNFVIIHSLMLTGRHWS